MTDMIMEQAERDRANDWLTSQLAADICLRVLDAVKDNFRTGNLAREMSRWRMHLTVLGLWSEVRRKGAMYYSVDLEQLAERGSRDE